MFFFNFSDKKIQNLNYSTVVKTSMLTYYSISIIKNHKILIILMASQKTIVNSIGLSKTKLNELENKLRISEFEINQENNINDLNADEIKNKLGDGVAKAAIDKKIRGDAAKIGRNVALGAGVATSGSQNTGHVYSDLYKYTQLDKSDPLYMSPAEARTKSTIAGAVMGSLDSIVPAALASTLVKNVILSPMIGPPKFNL